MKKILLKLWNLIMKIVGSTDEKVDKALPIVVNVVEAVKKAIENKNFDMVTAVVKDLIPGTTDDILIDKAVILARRYIPEISIRLKIIETIADIENPYNQILAVFEELQKVKGAKWQRFCTELAQQILIDMSDNKITWGEAGVYVEMYYKTFVKNN